MDTPPLIMTAPAAARKPHAPQPVVGDVCFGFNVHYHVPPPDDGTEDARKLQPGGLLLVAVSLAVGAALTAVPWGNLRKTAARLLGHNSAKPSDGRQKPNSAEDRGSTKPTRSQTAPEEPAHDLLALIERERRRDAMVKAAEARAEGEEEAREPSPPDDDQAFTLEHSASLGKASGLLTATKQDGDWLLAQGPLRVEIAQMAEQVRLLREQTEEADVRRRAVLRESEAIEKAASEACRTHTDVVAELWQAEEQLSSLLQKAQAAQVKSHRTSIESLAAGSTFSADSGPMQVSSSDLERLFTGTPSYYS